jgi:hypothetical protein
MIVEIQSLHMTMSTKPTATDWIPLVQYALKKGVSLSTLRRHIKAGKIPFKVEDGRYLLFDDSKNSESDGGGLSVSLLQNDLQRAQEEIAELKTLIALYEEKIPHSRQGL